MKKSRFTESQIVSVLGRAERGEKVSDLCRELSISEPTFYNWRKKYAGMQPNRYRQLKQLVSQPI